MARTLGCLRPSGMFQDFSMRKRSSSVRCDLDLLHFISSAFLCVFVVSLTVSQKADIFISFFGLARRPPGGGLRGAFFALLDASLHFASIAPLFLCFLLLLSPSECCIIGVFLLKGLVTVNVLFFKHDKIIEEDEATGGRKCSLRFGLVAEASYKANGPPLFLDQFALHSINGLYRFEGSGRL